MPPPSFESVPAARSALMRSVRQKDTAPELAVRRWLHAQGLRYRLNVRDLPGTPDLVLPRWHTVVFVHGCFWHGHSCAHGRVVAKTRSGFWSAKIKANRERDRRQAAQLRREGWRVLRIWECECGNPAKLEALRAKICQGRRVPRATTRGGAARVERIASAP